MKNLFKLFSQNFFFFQNSFTWARFESLSVNAMKLFLSVTYFYTLKKTQKEQWMHNFKLNLSCKADAWANGGQLYLNFFLGKSVVKLKVLSLRIFYISSKLMLISYHDVFFPGSFAFCPCLQFPSPYFLLFISNSR